MELSNIPQFAGIVATGMVLVTRSPGGFKLAAGLDKNDWLITPAKTVSDCTKGVIYTSRRSHSSMRSALIASHVSRRF